MIVSSASDVSAAPERLPSVLWFADSSPLILLAKIGLLHLIPGMTYLLSVPQAVVDEVNDAPDDDLGRVRLGEIIAAGMVNVSAVAVPPEVADFRLGAGETSAIAMALDWGRQGGLRVEAVLDDGPARRAAKSLGVATVGTLGILIRAKDDGNIPAVAPYLNRLINAGMWLSEELGRQVAAAVGEIWP